MEKKYTVTEITDKEVVEALEEYIKGMNESRFTSIVAHELISSGEFSGIAGWLFLVGAYTGLTIGTSDIRSVGFTTCTIVEAQEEAVKMIPEIGEITMDDLIKFCDAMQGRTDEMPEEEECDCPICRFVREFKED